jgi:hypothetical protein
MGNAATLSGQFGPTATAASDAKAKGKNITIRSAVDLRDVERMVDMGRLVHDESQFGDLEYAHDKLMAFGANGLTDEGRKKVCLMMAESGSELVGIVVATVSEHWFSRELGASAMLFYVHPDHRGGMAAIKLLHGFRRWANNRRVKRININVTTGVDMARTDKLMRRLGFKFTGGNYVLGMSDA